MVVSFVASAVMLRIKLLNSIAFQMLVEGGKRDEGEKINYGGLAIHQ